MKKIILLTIGYISLLLGFIGIFLPILPTTPFVLLAASCFCSVSPKVYEKLLKSKYFGAYISNYRNKTPVHKSVKIKSIIFLWITLLVSSLFISSLWVKLILLAVGLGVTLHILLI